MQTRIFPDFGKELRRPFDVVEQCFDCAELYDGCQGRPDGQAGRCLDFYKLPDVGLGGRTGQVIPPSKMRGRTEPRVRRAAADTVRDRLSQVYAPVRADAEKRQVEAGAHGKEGGRGRKKTPVEQIPQGLDADSRKTRTIRAKAAGTNQQARRSSPVSLRGPDGERVCGCGRELQKRQRCCPTCGAERRREAVRHWQ